MALVDWLPFIGLLACIVGVRVISKDQGYEDGFDEGIRIGFTVLLRELCEGGITTTDDEIVFGSRFTIYDDGDVSDRISKAEFLEFLDVLEKGH